MSGHGQGRVEVGDRGVRCHCVCGWIARGSLRTATEDLRRHVSEQPKIDRKSKAWSIVR